MYVVLDDQDSIDMLQTQIVDMHMLKIEVGIWANHIPNIYSRKVASRIQTRVITLLSA